MTPHIAHLIAQAEQWRSEHIRAGRGVEAAASEIRIQALYDAAGVKRPKSSGRGPAA
ncbi:hypothetical protein [Methylobacterium indicum]|uniref:hypothetical protein n=1 Tax=Methylobacterium indicum TaxID=1775910 RepID=UPI000B0AA6F0|nr:hypothetical protein [Methylobacterium indicum]